MALGLAGCGLHPGPVRQATQEPSSPPSAEVQLAGGPPQAQDDGSGGFQLLGGPPRHRRFWSDSPGAGGFQMTPENEVTAFPAGQAAQQTQPGVFPAAADVATARQAITAGPPPARVRARAGTASMAGSLAAAALWQGPTLSPAPTDQQDHPALDAITSPGRLTPFGLCVLGAVGLWVVNRRRLASQATPRRGQRPGEVRR